jgi:hypothetical protein
LAACLERCPQRSRAASAAGLSLSLCMLITAADLTLSMDP